MTGEEAIHYIHSVPWQGTRLGLERVTELLKHLGNPEKKLRFVHIAGTNGKGSTAALLSAVLRAAGYRTGLYTSPYLQVFHERMSVDGVMITDEELGDLTEQVREVAQTMDDPPTEFEMMTALAMLFFLHRKCEIVVLEVGMGGRLDATNVIPAPEAAVICSIGIDHVHELGDTMEKIAYEKAGIIKDGCDVVFYGHDDPAVVRVVEDVCKEKNACLHTVDPSRIHAAESTLQGQCFSYRNSGALRIRLLGAHQLRNAATVLETVSVLRSKGYRISPEAVRDGMESAQWAGRFEVLSPTFIIDGGHNIQCINAVCAALKTYFPGKKVCFIVGVLADKEHTSMMRCLAPLASCFYTVTPQSPRALSAQALMEELECFGKPVSACTSALDAMERAMKNTKEGDVICAVGSLYLIGEIRTLFFEKKFFEKDEKHEQP